MAVEEHKAVVRRFVEEFWNKGNVVVADELLSATATITLPGMEQVSLADFKTFALTFRSAFPDWVSTAEAMVAEEDYVVERWTGRGTHRGEFQGIAPTERQVTVPGFVFYRLASGKITEFWGLFDRLALMQQLGAIPDHRYQRPFSRAREEKQLCESTHCDRLSYRISKAICMAN